MRNILTGSLAAVAIVVVLGLGGLTGDRGPGAPLWVFAGIDRSESDRENLGRNAHATSSLATLLRAEDRLTLFRLDYDCREIFEGAPPRDLERFQHDLADLLLPDPRREGTRPPLYFQQVVQRLEREPRQDLRAVVLFLGDGGDEDYELRPLYVQSVRSLAADDRVRLVAALGVAPELKSEVRARFQDVAPERFELRGHADWDLGTLKSWLRAVRTAPSENRDDQPRAAGDTNP